MSTTIRTTRRARSGAVAVAAGALLLAAAGPARADSHAVCTIDDQMQLSRSATPDPGPLTMRSTGGTTDCAGTLADALVRDGGFGDITLRLRRAIAQDPNGCVLSAGTGTLAAQIPRAIAILAPTYVPVDAGLSARQVGAALYLSGAGTAGEQAIAITGVARFIPDAGQSCLTGIRSGHLVSHLVVTTGSSSSAAGTDARQGSSDSAQVRSERASHKTSKRSTRHSHHRRHGRRHGTRRHHGRRR